jgi:AhpD family alkylhydroperoxidase
LFAVSFLRPFPPAALAFVSTNSPKHRIDTKVEEENPVEPRVDYLRVGRGAYEAMLGLEKYLEQSGLGAPLIDLIKLRASQINGCAYCIDMHWKDLRALGETEQRLYGLDAWEESPYYSDRERAALLWTEAVTNVTAGTRSRRGVRKSTNSVQRERAGRPHPGSSRH